jgi:peptidoglycan/LPS O-acetylase OafA/YrhL
MTIMAQPASDYKNAQITRFSKGDRLYILDLLRFVAAISVLCFHYFFRGEQGGFVKPLHLKPWLENFSFYGLSGVYLFFIISGFVISYSAHGRSPWDFAASRFSRVYPTYVLALTITSCVLFFSTQQGVSILQYCSNLTLFPQTFHQFMIDGAYWSIQYEVIFYGWVFIFILLGQFDVRTELVVTFWLVVAILNNWIFKIEPLKIIFMSEYVGLFAIGILLFRVREYGFNLWRIVLLTVSMVLSTLILADILKQLYPSNFSLMVFIFVMIGVFAIIFFATLYRGNMPFGRGMEILGGMTYPLYLLHQMIGYTMIDALFAFVSPIIAIFITTLLMLVLAIVIYYWFDRFAVPFVRTRTQQLFRRCGLRV